VEPCSWPLIISDDEALFGCYSILQRRCHVVVCLFDSNARTFESERATKEMGVTFEQWDVATRDPERWLHVESLLKRLRGAQHVLAPKPEFELNGHSPEEPSMHPFGILDHDRVGDLALKTWGPERVTLYQTYSRWGGRVREGTEVIPRPGWIAIKLRALSHYVSQQEHPPTASWFTQPDLREWLA
jgi:hypothetical protein